MASEFSRAVYFIPSASGGAGSLRVRLVKSKSAQIYFKVALLAFLLSKVRAEGCFCDWFVTRRSWLGCWN